ncbi:MAG: AccI family restriction endonuclease, partial [Verrucomicrobiae bacterium]|nr:AccI family restriction endonuclease [Verrucomicrobiae bacterium]
MDMSVGFGNAFERWLAAVDGQVEGFLAKAPALPWLDFWLNPRRLRGSDFLMRWSQGVWSEKRLIEAVNDTGEFVAVPYGPSGTAPAQSVRDFELYFERLEKAGLGKIKRPDLLIFHVSDREAVDDIVADAGGLSELPFLQEGDPCLKSLLAKAVMAVECENSLWKAAKMPGFNAPLRP